MTKRNLGIFLLLVAVVLFGYFASDRFFTAYNVENVIRRTSLMGILAIGAVFVIITGGIDLSIGSVVCLVGCLTPFFIVQKQLPVALVLPLMAVMCLAIGGFHGLLITKLKIQPFVVTLCGLLFYRGFARGVLGDTSQGFGADYQGLRRLATEEIFLFGWDVGIPIPAIIMAGVALAAALFLGGTKYGRYLFALGRNETATRLSGVNTDRMVIVAYMICAALSGLGGLLFILDSNTAEPSGFGNFYELFAIAGAVLGGCSLRGGTGSVIGVIIGIAVIQILQNLIIQVDWIPKTIEFAVIGAVILGGVVADEVVRGLAGRAKAVS
ncbi:MAG: ABC transporter permease [Planctomycetota bacterium]